MISKNKGGYYQIDELVLPGLIHGFSTKQFGNMAFKYGDKEKVEENRINFAKVSGINENSIVQMEIIHGAKVAVVSENDASKLNPGKYIPGVDGLVTNISGIALWLLTGDCSPIIFYDPKKRVIGLVHSGWRGTMGKIAVIMFTKMLVNFGSNSKDILVGFGPSIEKCHYEKSSEIVAPYRNPEWDEFLEDKNGLVSIDLNGFTISQLLEVGVSKENIYYSSFCVADHNDEFFSQQMEKAGKDQPGRFATIMEMV